jgi:hypothetical protein
VRVGAPTIAAELRDYADDAERVKAAVTLNAAQPA